MDGSGDTVLHQCLAKIQQIPQLHSRQAKVSQQLLLMSWMNIFDRFQFEDHLSFNDQVGAKPLLKSMSFKFDGNGNLTLNRKSSFFQSLSQRYFVNRFK